MEADFAEEVARILDMTKYRLLWLEKYNGGGMPDNQVIGDIVKTF